MQVQNNMKLKVQDALLYACMSCSVCCDDGQPRLAVQQFCILMSTWT